jgi:hypothetical protein
VVQIAGSAEAFSVRASGPLDETGVTSQTGNGDIARQWYAAAKSIFAEDRTMRVIALCE